MRHDYESAQPPMVHVRLLGVLGRLFGRDWHVRAWSPQDAMRAISVNCKDFKEALIRYTEQGVGYKVFRGKGTAGAVEQEEDLQHPVGAEVMTVAPVPMGSGGLGRILLGVALVGVGFLTGGSTWFYLGGAMVLQGVVELMTPQPSTPKNERDSSFLVNQAARTSRDFDPIPVLYGQRIIQSMPPLSSGVVTYEI